MRSDRPMFSSSSTIRIRFIRRKEHAKRGAAQFAFDQQNVAAQQQGAFSGDRQSQAHAALLEGNRRLEQAAARLLAQAGTGIVDFDRHLANRQPAWQPESAARSRGFGGILEQVGQHAFHQIFVGKGVGFLRHESHVVRDLRMAGLQERDPLFEQMR